MQKVTSLDQIQNDFSLTIGNFDGVHLGHQQLLKSIISKSKEIGHKVCLLTFKPHPKKILNPSIERFLLTSYEQKAEILESMGVDYLLEVPFNRDFSTNTPEEFIEKFLIPQKKLKSFFAGYDLAFGANKSGDIETIKKLLKGSNIELFEQDCFKEDDKVISSTLIREHLANGRVEKMNEMLGRKFSLEGIVVKGEGRGRQIGFPTANIQISKDQLIPNNGVYITQSEYRGMKFNSVTNIGFNPTFNDGKSINIETNIFDFNEFIYGEKIRVMFHKKIRNEQKFSSVNDLIAQIKLDVDESKNYF